ncbi:MAG: glutaredoxin domain-containing protein [Candidatus Micrarchaeia archaeon]
MLSGKFAAFAISALLLLSFSGCISIVDDTKEGAQPSVASAPLPPSPPSSAPDLGDGKVPQPNMGNPYMDSKNVSSALELLGRMMGANGTGFPPSNASGMDAEQLALLQQMMANGSGGYSGAQQLAALQQMMAASGGASGSASPNQQQLAILQQMMAKSSGTGGMSPEQLALLQQMLAGNATGGSAAQTPAGAGVPSDGNAMPVSPPKAKTEVNVTYFYKPGCPYCAKVAPLISQMRKNFAEYNWKEMNVETAEGYAQFDATIRRLNLPDSYYVVPFVTVNDRALVGVSEISDSLPSVLAGLS